MSSPIALMWHRRDLRLHDNAALYYALKAGRPVLPLFIFDKDILDHLDDKRDRRVEFIYKYVLKMQEELQALGSSLIVRYGRPIDVFKQLTQEYEIVNVFTNYDFETYAKNRDNEVATYLKTVGAGFHTYKDQTIFDRDEVLTGSGKPYTVSYYDVIRTCAITRPERVRRNWAFTCASARSASAIWPGRRSKPARRF